MFTGIITDIGTVRAIADVGDSRFEFTTAYDTQTIDLGASIACSGACMTVVAKGPGWFAIEASAESLDKTTMASWREGTRINLERALSAGDELGGHIVSGHVDGVGSVVSVTPENASQRFVFEAPAALAPYIAAKGSVTIDGVSLTVNDVEDLTEGAARFGVNVISHTQQATTLGDRAPGDTVNLEIDMLARYVARLLERN